MEFRTPWDPVPVPPPLPQASPSPPKPRGRRPAKQAAAVPPWRFHHLTITGPAEAVASFAAAARGAGIVPWRVEASRIEEDVFHLAASQPRPIRSLTVEGCRILARQFRERVENRAAQAAAQVGRSRACPFDLHALLPVPAHVLELGLTHPQAQAWLKQHWGLTDSLRQVAQRPRATAGRRLPGGHRVIGYSFFTAGETPDVAMAQLRPVWPTLRFTWQPRALE
jgi:hypothetical protein